MFTKLRCDVINETRYFTLNIHIWQVKSELRSYIRLHESHRYDPLKTEEKQEYSGFNIIHTLVSSMTSALVPFFHDLKAQAKKDSLNIPNRKLHIKRNKHRQTETEAQRREALDIVH